MNSATPRSAISDLPPLARDIEMLRNIPLFAGLPTARLALIAYTGEIVRFEPGEVIIQQGDPADAVYIIAEGEAEAWLTHSAGHRLRLGVVGPHSLIGLTVVLCHSRRPVTVQATDRVVAFKTPAKVFLQLVRESPDIAMQVMTTLAQRVERNIALLLDRATPS